MTPLPLDVDRLPEILVPRNQCGLDWCFDFHGTEVSNTCGLDSALMSVYLRWKYCGLRWNIPTNEPNSKELVLLDVLMLIDATNNDARQYWCERMLGWKIVTNASLYGEIPPVFHDHVRFLFNGNRQMREIQSSFRTIEVHIHVLGSASSINQGFVDGYCVSEGWQLVTPPTILEFHVSVPMREKPDGVLFVSEKLGIHIRFIHSFEH
jgi:hypothetical protein